MKKLRHTFNESPLVTLEDNFVELDKEQDQVGPHGEPPKVQFEVPKNMKGGGELKNILVEQDVQQIVQSTKVSTLALEKLQPQEPINIDSTRYMII